MEVVDGLVVVVASEPPEALLLLELDSLYLEVEGFELLVGIVGEELVGVEGIVLRLVGVGV